MIIKYSKDILETKVKVFSSDIIYDDEFSYTNFAIYKRYQKKEFIIGKVIKIKTRNWLGFKLKKPIYTIEYKYTTMHNSKYLKCTKVFL